jgi:metallo-beta-lactamase family protein
MHIQHHGAHTGVTGSCHQVFFDDRHSVLVDCGAFQGQDARGRDGMEIDFPLDGIDALIVTHVHQDHVGRIPYLLKAGFHKPIYCTRPTAKMLPIMLEDSYRLGISKNRNEIKDFLNDLSKLIHPCKYHEWLGLGGKAKFRFQPAGHILGSAYVEIDHGEERFVLSGDLGAHCTPIMKTPVSPERADFLVLESTYGNRLHEGRDQRVKILESILCQTMANSGVTIIPAFSLGRTQEILFELNKIMEEVGHATKCSLLKKIDVIVDSPLALKLTSIYEAWQEYWSEEARETLRIDDQPLVFENLIEIDAGSDHREALNYLLKSHKPAIVIAGSGMCTGGRVVDYLKAFLGRETTDVVFVGFQALGTTGRAIQEAGKVHGTVQLDNMMIPVKAATHTITGYSAHADQNDLIEFVKGISVKPKEIRLVHGENEAKTVLAEKLTSLGYNVTWQELETEDEARPPKRPSESELE